MAWDTTKNFGDLIGKQDWNDMVDDQKNHSSRHSQGGGDQISVTDLDGSSGTNGQVLKTDGSNLTFGSGATVDNVYVKKNANGEITLTIFKDYILDIAGSGNASRVSYQESLVEFSVSGNTGSTAKESYNPPLVTPEFGSNHFVEFDLNTVQKQGDVFVGVGGNVQSPEFLEDGIVVLYGDDIGGVELRLADADRNTSTTTETAQNVTLGDVNYVKIDWDGTDVTATIQDSNGNSDTLTISGSANYPSGNTAGIGGGVADRNGSAAQDTDVEINGMNLSVK